MPPLIDMRGWKVNRLTVLYRDMTRKRVQWVCRCDCGTLTVVESQSIRTGHTASCGCYMKERSTERCVERAKHNHNRRKKRTITYNTWISMRRRCDDPTEKAYPYYGARGITVCKRWYKFENFLADMGPRPKNKTIDRINNFGNYTPKNCRWATRSEQMLNRRPYKWKRNR